MTGTGPGPGGAPSSSFTPSLPCPCRACVPGSGKALGAEPTRVGPSPPSSGPPNPGAGSGAPCTPTRDPQPAVTRARSPARSAERILIREQIPPGALPSPRGQWAGMARPGRKKIISDKA